MMRLCASMLVLVLVSMALAGGPRLWAQNYVLPTITRPAGELITLPVTALPVDTTIGGALRTLASRAGVVFVGKVSAIERKGGVMEITLDVEQSVQGRVSGTYTLREWVGLWSAGQQRYALGQRAMFFLREPNGAGLSSPVDGMDGVVSLVPMGADAVPLLDVRRIATRVQRTVGEPMQVEVVALTDAMAALKNESEPDEKALPEGWRGRPVIGPVMAPGRLAVMGRRVEAR